jgi:hypothetical protein
VIPLVSFMIMLVVCVGFVRSWKKLCRLPGNIFSKPTTSTQSAWPCAIMFRPMYKPVEPVEQLLLTLYTGMPVMPN